MSFSLLLHVIQLIWSDNEMMGWNRCFGSMKNTNQPCAIFTVNFSQRTLAGMMEVRHKHRFKPPNTMDHPLEQWIGSTACVLDYSTIWHLFYLYLNHTNISQTNCCKYSISCISAIHILEFKLAFLSIICLSKLLVWSMNYCLHAVNHNVLIWQLTLNILWLAERGTLKPLDEF